MSHHKEEHLEIPRQIAEHVETIARQEQDFLSSRSPAERFADRVAAFAGRISFVVVHLSVFAIWVLWNQLPQTNPYHFDPFPYALFDTLVALEAILLASFILMRQTSLARRADEREHLMLQILLLTEKEVSAVVRMNHDIASHLGLRDISGDPEIQEMGQPTSIDQVAQTIQEKLSGE
ncbi:DUF1003 domain-containing protein [Silvibacterium acidisoli]|uniref:DUF1003 domain-containing protein n=1 Tax=Acidobacteriaceae bacterium ZG23-2 TaxID=2883246 RepID=UPI00406CF669